MDSAQLIVTCLSLILNTVQAMFLLYLRAKFAEYPTNPSGVVIVRDADGKPSVREDPPQA